MGVGERVDRKGGVSAAPLVVLVHQWGQGGRGAHCKGVPSPVLQNCRPRQARGGREIANCGHFSAVSTFCLLKSADNLHASTTLCKILCKGYKFEPSLDSV